MVQRLGWAYRVECFPAGKLLSNGAGRSIESRKNEDLSMADKLSTKKGGGMSIGFPDVCKTPAPPAPFVPVPYPNSQYQKNLRKANKVDAAAKAGNSKAKALQQEAINNLARSMGDEAGTLKGVKSATAAVQLGYTLHKGAVGKPVASMDTSMKMGLGRHNTHSDSSTD